MYSKEKRTLDYSTKKVFGRLMLDVIISIISFEISLFVYMYICSTNLIYTSVTVSRNEEAKEAEKEGSPGLVLLHS